MARPRTPFDGSCVLRGGNRAQCPKDDPADRLTRTRWRPDDGWRRRWRRLWHEPIDRERLTGTDTLHREDGCDEGRSFTVVCNGAAASVGLTGTAVTNVGTASGSQYTKDKVKGIGTATVATRMVGGVAYFKGNAAFLEIQFGVKHSKYANEWISVSKGQKDFAVISAGMTMSSALLEIAPVRPLSKSKVETFAGKSVVAVIGKVSPEEYVGTGTQHTYVGVAAPNRPVGISLNSIESGAHFHGTCTFSNWKHKFVVTKPSGATPITKTNL